MRLSNGNALFCSIPKHSSFRIFPVIGIKSPLRILLFLQKTRFNNGLLPQRVYSNLHEIIISFYSSNSYFGSMLVGYIWCDKTSISLCCCNYESVFGSRCSMWMFATLNELLSVKFVDYQRFYFLNILVQGINSTTLVLVLSIYIQ